MNIVTQDIKDIITNNTSLVFGTDIFIAMEPNKPDNCVTLYDATSSPVGIQLDGSKDIMTSTIQVRIRNLSYQNAWSQAEEIINVLHGIGQQIVNNTYYNIVRCMNGPEYLTFDNQDRVIIVTNFEIKRRTV